MDKFNEVIIEACKIKDEDTRVEMVRRFLRLKESGNEMKALFTGIKRSLERPDGWYN